MLAIRPCGWFGGRRTSGGSRVKGLVHRLCEPFPLELRKLRKHGVFDMSDDAAGETYTTEQVYAQEMSSEKPARAPVEPVTEPPRKRRLGAPCGNLNAMKHGDRGQLPGFRFSKEEKAIERGFHRWMKLARAALGRPLSFVEENLFQAAARREAVILRAQRRLRLMGDKASLDEFERLQALVERSEKAKLECLGKLFATKNGSPRSQGLEILHGLFGGSGNDSTEERDHVSEISHSSQAEAVLQEDARNPSGN